MGKKARACARARNTDDGAGGRRRARDGPAGRAVRSLDSAGGGGSPSVGPPTRLLVSAGRCRRRAVADRPAQRHTRVCSQATAVTPARTAALQPASPSPPLLPPLRRVRCTGGRRRRSRGPPRPTRGRTRQPHPLRLLRADPPRAGPPPLPGPHRIGRLVASTTIGHNIARASGSAIARCSVLVIATTARIRRLRPSCGH